jgi:hypothetical protein
VFLAARRLRDFVGYAGNIVGSVLVQVSSKTKLPILALTANEQSTDVINERSMSTTGGNCLNIGSIVLVEIS